jgi:hypothetical protein
VTKLSLLMKVLEGDLDSNVKCGNSLIDPQFYADQPGDLFSDELLYTINAFSWTTAFPFLSKGERFDVVLGNPPYLNIDTVWGKKDPRAAAIKSQYPDIYNDKTDIYYYFLARSIWLSGKYVAFICSRAFLESYKGDKLRQFIIDNSTVREVVDFQNYPVFRGVGITTAILQLEKRKASANDLVEVFQCQVARDLPTSKLKPFDENFHRITYPHKRLSSTPWNFAPPGRQKIFDKIDLAGSKLGAFSISGKVCKRVKMVSLESSRSLTSTLWRSHRTYSESARPIAIYRDTA